MIMKYYVYQHRKASNNEIFYVGKGQKKRAYDKYDRNFYWNNIVNKHGLIVEFIAYFKEEQDALDFEIEKIAEYKNKKIILANYSRGGTGKSGLIHSEETKKKNSDAHKGKVPWNKGKKTGLIPWNKGLTYTLKKKGEINDK